MKEEVEQAQKNYEQANNSLNTAKGKLEQNEKELESFEEIDTQKLFEDCRTMYLSLEGQYDCVVAHDSNALSIGFMQWHGNRALQLLKKICAANPSVAKSKLGTSYYNTIVNAADNAWSNYVPNATQAAAAMANLFMGAAP